MPPILEKLVVKRAPLISSKISYSFSLSVNVHKNNVNAPTSIHVAPIAIRCELILANSHIKTLIHFALSGISKPIAVSIACAMAILLDIGDI